MNDEVVRGSIILKDGQLMWPPPKPVGPPVPASKPKKAAAVVKAEPEPVNPFMVTFKDTMLTTAGKLFFH